MTEHLDVEEPVTERAIFTLKKKAFSHANLIKNSEKKRIGSSQPSSLKHSNAKKIGNSQNNSNVYF